MPFASTAADSKPGPAATEDAGEPAAVSETRSFTTDDTWEQERQVRLAAQRILSEHLRPPAADQHSADSSRTPFWPATRLDLTGATLIDFSFDNAAVSDASFDGATFIGDTRVREATFTGDTRFRKAIFTGDASVNAATFSAAAAVRRGDIRR
jgi:uncharacterized protein YjbI with pentapeptide repeats